MNVVPVNTTWPWANVVPRQLEAVSYGKEMPINAGHDENAWKENRRVEINYEAVPPLLK